MHYNLSDRMGIFSNFWPIHLFDNAYHYNSFTLSQGGQSQVWKQKIA